MKPPLTFAPLAPEQIRRDIRALEDEIKSAREKSRRIDSSVQARQTKLERLKSQLVLVTTPGAAPLPHLCTA